MNNGVKRRKNFLAESAHASGRTVHYSSESLLGRRNKRSKVTRRHKFLIVEITVSIGFCLIVAVSHLLSYAHFLADIYPVVKLGDKETVLKCNYAGKDLNVSIQLNKNVENYYRYKSQKQQYLKEGDFSRFVYSNKRDKTISVLAGKVRTLAHDNGLNNDQILELATCFVQNIPYDDARAAKVLSTSNAANYQSEQFPYETLFKNSGICTDKTYLGSLLLKELGFGTGILVFPEDNHVALGISVPTGYTDFSSKYAMMELTQTGFAPGSLPSGIDDNNGKPSYTLTKLSDLNETSDPSSIDLNFTQKIAAPTLVIDVNQGQAYERIVPVKNLENKILNGADVLAQKKANLSSAYSELRRRDRVQESAYSYYLSVPDTKLDCGYHYSYSYNYFSSPYYSSPYQYSCETVTNPSKGFAYSSYTGALGSYNNQVSFYNRLVNDYNFSLSVIKKDINNYLSYSYN